jgi:hypothetical protein
MAARRNAVSVIGTLRVANHKDFFRIRFASVPEFLQEFLFLPKLFTYSFDVRSPYALPFLLFFYLHVLTFNRVLRRIFVPKRDGVTRGWRKTAY